MKKMIAMILANVSVIFAQTTICKPYGLNGPVMQSTFQSDGKILAVGRFTTFMQGYGSYTPTNVDLARAVHGIVQLHPNGTLDASFYEKYSHYPNCEHKPDGLNALFSMLVKPDNDILVGGFFEECSLPPQGNPLFLTQTSDGKSTYVGAHVYNAQKDKGLPLSYMVGVNPFTKRFDNNTYAGGTPYSSLAQTLENHGLAMLGSGRIKSSYARVFNGGNYAYTNSMGSLFASYPEALRITSIHLLRPSSTSGKVWAIGTRTFYKENSGPKGYVTQDDNSPFLAELPDTSGTYTANEVRLTDNQQPTFHEVLDLGKSLYVSMSHVKIDNTDFDVLVKLPKSDTSHPDVAFQKALPTSLAENQIDFVTMVPLSKKRILAGGRSRIYDQVHQSEVQTLYCIKEDGSECTDMAFPTGFSVEALAKAPKGKFYALLNYTDNKANYVNSTVRRFNANGSFDDTFTPIELRKSGPLNISVNPKNGNQVIVGGSFNVGTATSCSGHYPNSYLMMIDKNKIAWKLPYEMKSTQ